MAEKQITNIKQAKGRKLASQKTNTAPNKKADKSREDTKFIRSLNWLMASNWAKKTRFNEMSRTIEINEGERWRGWTDSDTLAVYHHVQTQRYAFSKELLYDAVAVYAHQKRAHPLRDYLSGLRWDGTDRLSVWLHRYAGVENTVYAAAVGKAWAVAAVARVFEPGCKSENLLILEGPQGIGKSRLLRALSCTPEWFADDLPDLRQKDAQEFLSGRWVIELGELAGLKKADVELVKRFIATRTDTFRPSYGRHTEQRPRTCIFAGTTNADGYLSDATGNRRFWPVACTVIDVENIERDRDQLWAEAVYHYRDGAQWWLDGDDLVLAEAEQKKRELVDPWQNAVNTYIENRNQVTVTELLADVFDIPLKQQRQLDYNRAADCLKRAGRTRKQRTHGGKPRQGVYVKS